MRRRRFGRLVAIPTRVCVALALLLDIPQQLELGGRTTEILTSWRARLVTIVRHESASDAAVVTRAAAHAVTGVVWLATLSLPYAESVEPQPEP